MAPRELLGIAFVVAGVVIAPLSQLFGRMWWLATSVLILVGVLLYVSSWIAQREKESGGELNDMARGHGAGIGPQGNWSAADTSSTEDGD